MSMLVRFLDESKDSKSILTEDSIYGNLFGLSFAGFETTFSTLAYGIVALAAYPEWQEWLREEVDEVGDADLSYDVYPKLVRCLAYQYEISRLYSPVGHSSRLVTSTQTITLPSGSVHHVALCPYSSSRSISIHLSMVLQPMF